MEQGPQSQLFFWGRQSRSSPGPPPPPGLRSSLTPGLLCQWGWGRWGCHWSHRHGLCRQHRDIEGLCLRHTPKQSGPSCQNRSSWFCPGMNPMAFRWSEDECRFPPMEMPPVALPSPRRAVATNAQAPTSAFPQHKASCDTRIPCVRRGSGLLEFWNARWDVMRWPSPKAAPRSGSAKLPVTLPRAFPATPAPATARVQTESQSGAADPLDQ